MASSVLGLLPVSDPAMENVHSVIRVTRVIKDMIAIRVIIIRVIIINSARVSGVLLRLLGYLGLLDYLGF